MYICLLSWATDGRQKDAAVILCTAHDEAAMQLQKAYVHQKTTIVPKEWHMGVSNRLRGGGGASMSMLPAGRGLLLGGRLHG